MLSVLFVYVVRFLRVSVFGIFAALRCFEQGRDATASFDGLRRFVFSGDTLLLAFP